MTLRAKKPDVIQKRFKALFYGEAGSGKTTAAIQFPKSYLIDTERGAEHKQYTDILSKNGGVIFQTSDFDEVYKEVKELLTTKHDYKTLIIDPITIVYDNLIDLSIKEIISRSKDPSVDGTEYGRHISFADRKIKPLLNMLLRLDMNIILTAHAKNEYIGGKSTNQQTFDACKKLSYLFDVNLEIQKRNKKRIAIIKKSRIKEFEDMDTFEFSYTSIAEKFGVDIIEKECEKEILATSEQVDKIKNLISLLKVEEETIEKWLSKANASTLEEMETSKIQACIDYLTEKFTGNKKTGETK